MPPKKAAATVATDVYHVTFHFYKSAVLLSVSASTTVAELKSQLLRALSAPSLQRAVFEPKLPHLADPISDDDFQIYEDLADTDAEQDVIGYRTIEGDRKDMGKSVRQLGFKRWKTLYISFKNADGDFEDPEYTEPSVEDEESQ